MLELSQGSRAPLPTVVVGWDVAEFHPLEGPGGYCSISVIFFLTFQILNIFLFLDVYFCVFVAVVQSLSCIQIFVTPQTAACQAFLSLTISQSFFKLISIESVMLFNHLILCHPLLLLPSIFPSIRVFSNESVLCIRWPKYCSFSFSINPSKEYSGLISFGMDWLDLLAVKGTLKSLLQHRSSKASILWC